MSVRFELPFGSFLSYGTRGRPSTQAANQARHAKDCLKGDKEYPGTGMLFSRYAAQRLREHVDSDPALLKILGPTKVLIPVPSSSLMKPGTLRVPHRLAQALCDVGMGSEVLACLHRTEAVPKSSMATAASERLTPEDHFRTMGVDDLGLHCPEDVVLVDDVVTRGSTFMGAAWRLLDACPECRLGCFAMMRAVSTPEDFKNVKDPVVGTIKLFETGELSRWP